MGLTVHHIGVARQHSCWPLRRKATQMEPVTVTINGAEKALNIGKTKLYELISEGRLKTVKIGRRTLVTTDSIRALVDVA